MSATWVRHDSEGEEAFDVSATPDRVRDHESQQTREARKVAIASSAAHKGLPVVVEGFDSTRRRMILTECGNAIEEFEEILMQFPHRYVCTSRSSAQHLCQTELHLSAGLGVQYVAALLLDGVGLHQRSTGRHQTPDLVALLGCQTYLGSQKQPPLTAAEYTQFRTGSKQDAPTDFIDGLACALHNVKRIMHDGHMLQIRVVPHSIPEGLEHLIGGCERYARRAFSRRG